MKKEINSAQKLILARIKKIMKAKRITQQTLANGVGLSRPALTLILLGKTNLTFDRLHSIAKVLQENPIYLTDGILENIQDPDKISSPIYINIPLINLQDAHKWKEAVEFSQEKIITSAPDVFGRNCFGITVENDVMMPEFRKGDRLVVDPDIKPDSNDFVIVRLLESQENIIRQYVLDGSKVHLIPLNPLYDKITVMPDKIIACGVIVHNARTYHKRQSSTP